MGGGILAWSLRKKPELAQKKGNAMTEAFPLDVTTELTLRHHELELITDSARDVNDILVSLSVLDSSFFERIHRVPSHQVSRFRSNFQTAVRLVRQASPELKTERVIFTSVGKSNIFSERVINCHSANGNLAGQFVVYLNLVQQVALVQKVGRFSKVIVVREVFLKNHTFVDIDVCGDKRVEIPIGGIVVTGAIPDRIGQCCCAKVIPDITTKKEGGQIEAVIRAG